MKNILKVFALLAIITGCQEDFSFDEIVTGQTLNNIETDVLIDNGTFIATSGSQFLPGQTINGWDNLMPTLESAGDDNENGPNSFCPFGYTIFLYQNNVLVNSWDEFVGSHFTTTTDASNFRVDFSWTIPPNTAPGTDFQVGIGMFSECIPGSRIYSQPQGKKSRTFEIVAQRCEIEITMSQPHYIIGDRVSWSWTSTSDGPIKSNTASFYENGVLLSQYNRNLLNFGHSLGVIETRTTYWEAYPASKTGIYRIVYVMDCGEGRTANTEANFEVGEAGGVIPPFIPEF